MKILKLSAENIKRLSVVEITPDGSPVLIIGGKNGAGKSSVLDAIAMALGGAAATPGKPVRAGHLRGKVVVDLGDLIVTRTFTATGGSALIVANKEGARFTSPQALLDKLIGRLSFDPLAFERMDPKQQRETLRALVGLDTTDVDASIATVFTDRAVLNRTVKQLDGQIAGTHQYPEAPIEEISIAALTAELDAADTSRRVLERARSKYQTAERDHKAATDAIDTIERRLSDLHAEVVTFESALVTARQVADVTRLAIDTAHQDGLTAKAAVIDSTPIRARLGEADSINRQVRANHVYVELQNARDEQQKAAQALTDRLAVLEAEKRGRLAAVTFPLPGLSVDEQGVTLNGVPFDQASQAERLRASVAMGLALNPQLKVLLVREGSSLDSDSLRLLGELAAAADAQVWVERVAESRDGVSVLIEDGAVKPELEVAEVAG